MMKIFPVFFLLAAAAVSVPAFATKPAAFGWPELGIETRINFPYQGTIRNFEADGNDGIWLEDRQRRWYYADVIGTCQDLTFAQAIGFDTRGSSTLDRFSSIIVRGERCPLASLVTSSKPLPRKERQRIHNATVAASKDVVAPSN
ncbi:DUF6491 family protein [Sphingorhabdus sp.]|uniref:DUF6491 family protein n=1 Tax=Sphingorhabdus sp. TaxID=1902408 RepID=UPI00391C82A9